MLSMNALNSKLRKNATIIAQKRFRYKCNKIRALSKY